MRLAPLVVVSCLLCLLHTRAASASPSPYVLPHPVGHLSGFWTGSAVMFAGGLLAGSSSVDTFCLTASGSSTSSPCPSLTIARYDMFVIVNSGSVRDSPSLRHLTLRRSTLSAAKRGLLAPRLQTPSNYSTSRVEISLFGRASRLMITR